MSVAVRSQRPPVLPRSRVPALIVNQNSAIGQQGNRTGSDVGNAVHRGPGLRAGQRGARGNRRDSKCPQEFRECLHDSPRVIGKF